MDRWYAAALRQVNDLRFMIWARTFVYTHYFDLDKLPKGLPVWGLDPITLGIMQGNILSDDFEARTTTTAYPSLDWQQYEDEIYIVDCRIVDEYAAYYLTVDAAHFFNRFVNGFYPELEIGKN